MVGRILVIIGTVSGWVKRTRADYCPEVIAGVALGLLRFEHA
jgi:hypothetical protein